MRHDMYDRDVITVKQYGEHLRRVTYTSACRMEGVEDDREYSAKGTVNSEKLANNIARARSKVTELVLCNPWKYWCTLTLSPKKYDRYNLKGYVRDLGSFLTNYNRYCAPEEKVRYLLVPEMHKDGAWHMHGFLNGIKERDIVRNRNNYYTWKQYDEKFGYMSLDYVKDIEKASSYMKKYMVKDISKSVTKLGAHSYYASKGLKVAKVLYKGHAALHCPWDWEMPEGYVKIKTFDDRREDMEEFLEILP